MTGPQKDAAPLAGGACETKSEKSQTEIMPQAQGLSHGSMSFLIVRHDDGCPMIMPTPGECTCASPKAEVVTRNKFVATVTRDRKARRAAARAAAKAMRKAKGGVQ